MDSLDFVVHDNTTMQIRGGQEAKRGISLMSIMTSWPRQEIPKGDPKAKIGISLKKPLTDQRIDLDRKSF